MIIDKIAPGFHQNHSGRYLHIRKMIRGHRNIIRRNRCPFCATHLPWGYMNALLRKRSFV